MNKITSIFMVLLLLLVTYSCNYQPCRGQDYILKGISHEEFIATLDTLRSNYPKYRYGEDRIHGHVPYYSFDIAFQDIDFVLSCTMHMGDQISNPPTHLEINNFSTISGMGNLSWIINHPKLDETLNKTLIEKFETEILNGMDLDWKRDPCN